MQNLKKLNWQSIRKYNDTIFSYGLLLFFIIVSSILRPQFLSPRNLQNVFFSSLPFIIASYAQTIAIIAGGVDLSIGPLISLTTTIMATKMIIDSPLGFIPAIVLVIVAAAFVGLLNGILIIKFKLQALITTLSTSIVLSGLALFVLEKPGGKIHSGFARFMSGYSVQFILFIIISVVLWLLLNRTSFGKAIYAAGGNEANAYSSGINTTKTKIITYVIVSIIGSIAGIFLACQMYSGDPTAGTPITLRSMTAAVMGGASFSGGRGRIESTLAAALVLSIINNVLNLVGLSAFYQFVVQGALLIISIAISSRYAGGKRI